MARPKTGKKLTTRPGGVVLVEGLPKYAEDYVKFIVERLPDYEPCSIPNFMRAIGFNPRPGGSTTGLYGKFIETFYEAEEAEKVSRNGFKWRVVSGAQKARAS